MRGNVLVQMGGGYLTFQSACSPKDQRRPLERFRSGKRMKPWPIPSGSLLRVGPSLGIWSIWKVPFSSRQSVG